MDLFAREPLPALVNMIHIPFSPILQLVVFAPANIIYFRWG